MKKFFCLALLCLCLASKSLMAQFGPQPIIYVSFSSTSQYPPGWFDFVPCATAHIVYSGDGETILYSNIPGAVGSMSGEYIFTVTMAMYMLNPFVNYYIITNSGDYYLSQQLYSGGTVLAPEPAFFVSDTLITVGSYLQVNWTANPIFDSVTVSWDDTVVTSFWPVNTYSQQLLLPVGLHQLCVTGHYSCADTVVCKTVTVQGPLFYEDTTKSVSSFLQEEEVVVFPNPATDYFSIHGEYRKIRVSDSVGKLVLEEEEKEKHVVSNLSQGFYNVFVIKEGEVECFLLERK